MTTFVMLVRGGLLRFYCVMLWMNDEEDRREAVFFSSPTRKKKIHDSPFMFPRRTSYVERDGKEISFFPQQLLELQITQ